MKRAALTSDVQLTDYQNSAVDQAERNGGRLLLAHPPGSGKTIAYKAIYERLKEKGMANHALVVAPAGLQQNFVNSAHKFSDRHAAILTSNLNKIPAADYHVVSFDKFRKDPVGYMRATNADTLIIDELHKARNVGTKNLGSLQEASRLAKNVIAGTGSVANNHPRDILPQIDIVSGGKHRLGPLTSFDANFVGKKTVTHGPLKFLGLGPKTEETYLKNTHILGPEVKKWVNFSDKLPPGDMPEKRQHDVKVEMGKHQQKIYDWTMKQVDPFTAWKIRHNLPPTAKEFDNILPILNQQRQISNATHRFDKKQTALQSAMDVPKTKALVDNLDRLLKDDPEHKAIVYSNFVHSGISPVEAYLADKGISYGKFIGSGNEGVTHKGRQADVDDYVAGKKRVMLLSGAGIEGLNLLGTKSHHTLDPHYNPEVLHQSEARGIRRGSPVPHVDVYRYVSQPRRNLLQKAMGKRDHGIDEWVYGIAHDKDKFNRQLIDLMKQPEKTARLNPYQVYMERIAQ